MARIAAIAVAADAHESAPPLLPRGSDAVADAPYTSCDATFIGMAVAMP